MATLRPADSRGPSLQPSPNLLPSNGLVAPQETLNLNISDDELAARTLYVGNLPFRVRWQDLKDLFRKAGTVARADVALGPDNRSKGHGNVVFASPSDVQVGKEMFQGYAWMNRVLEVRSDKPFPDHVASQHNPQTQPGLYFVPMQYSLSDQSALANSQAPESGNISGAQSMTNLKGDHDQRTPSQPGMSSGQANAAHMGPMGFVGHPGGFNGMYPSHNGPMNGINPMMGMPMMPSGMLYGGSQMGMMPVPMGYPMGMMPYGMVPFMPPVPSPAHQANNVMSQKYLANFPGRVLFVGNLPYQMQWQDLKDLFRQAGRILRADVALDPNGRSRGFGTVVYATLEDAQRAVQMFNGQEYSGRTLKVHFDKYNGGTSPSLSSTNLPETNDAQSLEQHSLDVSGPDPESHSFSYPSGSEEGPILAPRTVDESNQYGMAALTLEQLRGYGVKPWSVKDNKEHGGPERRSGEEEQQKGDLQKPSPKVEDERQTPASTPAQGMHRNPNVPGPIYIPPSNFASNFNFGLMYSSHGRTMSNTGPQSPAAGPGSLMTPSTLSTNGPSNVNHYNRNGPFSFQIPPPTPPLYPHHLLTPGVGSYNPALDSGYHDYHSSVNLAPGAPVHSESLGTRAHMALSGGKGGLGSVAEEDDVPNGQHRTHEDNAAYRSSESGNMMAHLMMDNHGSPLFPVHPSRTQGGGRSSKMGEVGSAADRGYFFDAMPHHETPAFGADHLAEQYGSMGLAPSPLPAHSNATTLQLTTPTAIDEVASADLPEKDKHDKAAPTPYPRGSMDSARPLGLSNYREMEGRRASSGGLSESRTPYEDDAEAGDANGHLRSGHEPSLKDGLGAKVAAGILGSGVWGGEKLGFWNRKRT